jgi:hypothetical protein
VSDDRASVSVPLDRVALFPPACAGCGDAGAKSIVTLWSNTPWRGFFQRLGRRPTRVPVCARCAWPLRLWRLARAASIVGILVAFILLIMERPLPGSPAMTIVIAALLCGPLVPLFWTPAVTVFVAPKAVIYTFRRLRYAKAFADLNGTRVDR